MGKFKDPVDLVFLWVDGSDPEWILKKKEYLGEAPPSEADGAGRYMDNDELRYALRSVEKYLPWIRKIFIVTDDQRPKWLKASSKITVVNQESILPAASNPCFNSNIIEYFLYKIPGLSEYFLYANDDMFVNKALGPGFFFAEDGFPFVRLKRKPLGKWHIRLKRLTGKKVGHYRAIVEKTALLVAKKFGKYYSGVPHHNVDAYRKTDYREAVEKIFKNEIETALQNRIRSGSDLQRFAFGLYPLVKDRAHLEYVGNDCSLRLLLFKDLFKEKLEQYQPSLFCLNDGERATDEDRKRARQFLEQYFPQKSEFEF